MPGDEPKNLILHDSRRAVVPAGTQPQAPGRARRHSRKAIAAALLVATASDIGSFAATFAPPVQLAIDFATAVALFLILGRRWAILPGLVAEAIPGLGVFPVWILVVVSIVAYDEIRRPR